MFALPGHAKALRRDVVTACAAACASDAQALADAVTALTVHDPQQVRALLHHVTLDLLERSYPDGLTGEDVRLVFDATVAATATWLPDLDPQALALVLTGALSVHEEDAPPIDWSSLLTACVTVTHVLLSQAGVAVEEVVDAAFVELHRAQTIELP